LDPVDGLSGKKQGIVGVGGCLLGTLTKLRDCDYGPLWASEGGGRRASCVGYCLGFIIGAFWFGCCPYYEAFHETTKMVALGLVFPLGWEGRRWSTSANYGYWSTPVLFPPAVGTWKSGSTQQFLLEAEIRIYSTLPWLRNT